MGAFKLRKNKKYSYTPRHYKGEGNPYEIKHQFDEYRSTIGSTGGIKSRINSALNDYKGNINKDANKRVLIIIGILLVLFLFFIGFDLSIFFSKK